MIKKYPNFNFEQFLIERDLDWKIHDSGDHTEIAIDCPECDNRGEPTKDTSKKLWMNTDKATFYCYRCQWAGTLVHLVSKIAKSPMETTMQLLKGTPLDPLEHLDLHLAYESYEPDMVDEDTIRVVEMPYGYEPIEEPHPYLEERGIPWEYARKNDWGIGAAGYTKDRLIVPFYMGGEIVFWQARATWESDDKKFRKVLNPKGVSARSVLFNYDTAKNHEEIILVEGFVDAVKCGPDAMAVNGKVIHPQQIEWLSQTGAKSLILAFDEDAWTDETPKKPCSVKRSTDLLRAYGFKVRACRIPDNMDPGDFPFRDKHLREILSSSKEL